MKAVASHGENRNDYLTNDCVCIGLSNMKNELCKVLLKATSDIPIRITKQ